MHTHTNWHTIVHTERLTTPQKHTTTSHHTKQTCKQTNTHTHTHTHKATTHPLICNALKICWQRYNLCQKACVLSWKRAFLYVRLATALASTLPHLFPWNASLTEPGRVLVQLFLWEMRECLPREVMLWMTRRRMRLHTRGLNSVHWPTNAESEKPEIEAGSDGFKEWHFETVNS